MAKDQPVAVYDLNRAASAYLHALERKNPTAPMAPKDYDLRAAALYKDAWTLFKQNRFEASTKQFVEVLKFSDEDVKKTGTDPGYRKEVYPYIADSLLGSLDFAGPPASEPYMQRPDILDIYPDNAKAEVKLHVAIDRVRDASIIPQDKPWTINIYLALADDFRSYGEFGNAIEVYTECLRRWPMDPTAPQTQESIAETYDQLNVARNRLGTPEHDAIAAKVARGAHGARRLRRQHAVGRCEQGQPRSARRGRSDSVKAASSRPRRDAHQQRQRARSPRRTNTADATRQSELLLLAPPPSTSSRRSAGAGLPAPGRERHPTRARAAYLATVDACAIARMMV